jgi:hypothetical protein
MVVEVLDFFSSRSQVCSAKGIRTLMGDLENRP